MPAGWGEALALAAADEVTEKENDGGEDEALDAAMLEAAEVAEAVGATAAADAETMEVEMGEAEELTMRVAFWNTRVLDATKSAHNGEAGKKLTWLGEYLKETKPDVLFLMEVSGSTRQSGRLRQWLRRQGYDMRFMPGDETAAAGDERAPPPSSPDDAASPAELLTTLLLKKRMNGIVAAVRMETTVIEKHAPLAPRVMGVKVRHRAEGSSRAFCCVHGKHVAPAATAKQFRAAEAWLETAGGGVMLGDLNKVPCVRWRAGRHVLDRADKELRRIMRWACVCCGAENRPSRAIGGEYRQGGEVGWTRYRSVKGEWGTASARIDVAVETGREEGGWELTEQVHAELGPPGEEEMLSDHLAIAIERGVRRQAGGPRRPKPASMGTRKKPSEVCEEFQKEARRVCFAEKLSSAREEELQDGGDKYGKAVSMVMDEVAAAAERVAAAKAKRREAACGPHGGRATLDMRIQQWRRRLKEAVKHRRSGDDPDETDNPILFHRKIKSLADIRRWERQAGPQAVWNAIVRRCRCEVRAAAKLKNASSRAEDRRLVEGAEELEAATKGSAVDPAKQAQKVWNMVRGKKAGTQLEFVHEDDDPNKERVSCQSQRFSSLLADVGRRFVQKVDYGAVTEAFAAWVQHFMAPYEQLRGTGGGEWTLEEEITWPRFKAAINAMPRGKAVGADGISAEVLQAAGSTVQREIFYAVRDDVRARRAPRTWRKVLYSLLVKKPPNNPDVVAQRREIALMSQGMKLYLQVVRQTAYRRLLGRVNKAQMGWLPGYGCTDASLVSALAIQAARRSGRTLYMMFIDLATFFPAINRETLTVAELLHGLPPEVIELTALIYGAAGNKADGIQCQYDSAAGLGEPFANYMGALMGCVLSPDRAKILLNTVVTAIAVTAKGVKLYGHSPSQVDGTLRRVSQAVFADDWYGCFESEKQLKAAWAVWAAWEAMSGCRLGIKSREEAGSVESLKTVVTGVKWVGGMATAVPDPNLVTADGRKVPLIAHHEAYKHLGNWRRADGVDSFAWRKLERSFDAALGRLSKMHKPSHNDFMMVSNALLGGLGGFYFQTHPPSMGQLERIESRWRAVYNKKFRRARNTPRAELYAECKGRTQRRHLWSVAQAAILTAFGKAMADAVDTEQRAAVRAAIAMSFNRWGCRSDPRTWDYRHLRAALERSLKKAPCRYLGDAWMLASIEATAAESEEETEREERRLLGGGTPTPKVNWRWLHDVPASDPLHAEAAHFAAPGSKLLFEPVAAGGLGIEPSEVLLEAGVAAVGHVCCWPWKGCGLEGEWIRSFEEARRRNPRLPQGKEAERQWRAVMQALMELEEAGKIRPSRPEDVVACDSGFHAEEEQQVVDQEAVSELLPQLAAEKKGPTTSAAAWAATLKRCFDVTAPAPAEEWEHGGPKAEEAARGARLVFAMGGYAEASGCGGEARWMARTGGERSAMDGQLAVGVGEDGYLEGWEARAQLKIDQLRIDEEGYLCKASSQGGPGDEWPRMTEERLQEATPVEQAIARARMALGDVPVIDEWLEHTKGEKDPNKRKETHVNLHTTLAINNELVVWWARILPTAIYSLDGSRKYVPSDAANGIDGGVYSARAAVRHDGRVVRGMLEEEEGADNYLAELAAQMDALNEEPAGGRLILVFDATSPVEALRRFRRLHARGKQGYYVGRWYEALEALTAKHEVIVFIWQTSHVGAPLNEWADKEAAAAIDQMDRVRPVPRVPCKYASVAFPWAVKGLQAWASKRFERAAQAKLRLTSVYTQFWESGDMCVPKFDEDVERARRATLALRYQGDDLRWSMRRDADAVQLGCPHGCKNHSNVMAPASWTHFHFECQGCSATLNSRRLTLEKAEAAQELLGVEGKDESYHAAWNEMVELLKRGLPERRAKASVRYAAGIDHTRGSDQEVRMRRLVGGLVRLPRAKKSPSAEKTKSEKTKAVEKAVAEAVKEGLMLQMVGHEAAEEREAEEEKKVERQRTMAKVFAPWRRLVIEGGPARAAALARVRDARRRIGTQIGRWRQTGKMQTTAHEACARRMLSCCARMAREVDDGVVIPVPDVRAALWGMARHFRSWRCKVLTKIEAMGGKTDGWGRPRVGANGTAAARPTPALDATASRMATEVFRSPFSLAVLDRPLAGEPVAQRAIWWLGGEELEGTYAYRRQSSMAWAKHAGRAHAFCGGAAEEEARRKERSKRERAEARARQALGMRRWVGDEGTLSGTAVEPISTYVEMSVVPDAAECKRRKRQAEKLRRKAKRERKRRRLMVPVMEGAEADDGEFWAVEEVLETQQPRATRSAEKRPLRVKVRWVGHDKFNRRPWKDSWIPASRMTKDLQAAAKVMHKRGWNHWLAARAVRWNGIWEREQRASNGGRGAAAEPATAAAKRPRPDGGSWVGCLRAPRARSTAADEGGSRAVGAPAAAQPANGTGGIANGGLSAGGIARAVRDQRKRRAEETAAEAPRRPRLVFESAGEREAEVRRVLVEQGVRRSADGKTCPLCWERYAMLSDVVCRQCMKQVASGAVTRWTPPPLTAPPAFGPEAQDEAPQRTALEMRQTRPSLLRAKKRPLDVAEQERRRVRQRLETELRIKVVNTRAECARLAKEGKPYGDALAAYGRASADYREQVGGSVAGDGSRREEESGRSAAEVYSDVRSVIENEACEGGTMSAREPRGVVT